MDSANYSLGAVVRLTGLSAHTIRAWEGRHGAVRPERTAGGTRRFSAAEVSRLRLLHDAVKAGHRIGDIAQLSDPELEERLAALAPEVPSHPLAAVIEALERLDAIEVERLLLPQLELLGPLRFMREVAVPLMHDVGVRWENREGTVAAEHLLSQVTRSLLGVMLRATPRLPEAPEVIFTTPEGELHEFGALIAAVVAAAAGASVTYLGPQLPAQEVARAAITRGAAAVGLSLVLISPRRAREMLEELRTLLPTDIAIWAGGANCPDDLEGVVRLDLDELEREVARLRRAPRDAAGSGT